MTGRGICRAVLLVFAALYVLALAVLVIGGLGLFGQPRAPLAGIYLMPLGLPWNTMIDPFPEALWPWLAAAAPALNLAILAGLCRLLPRRSR